MCRGLGKYIHPLLALIASATDSELARCVEYLKAENKILRARLPKRLTVTKAERGILLKLGRPLGSKVKALVSIVSPRTFLRWLQQEKQTSEVVTEKPSSDRPKGNKTPDEVVELIIHMAKTDGWGAGRIRGELKGLGYRTSRSTINRILRENGFPVDPPPRNGTWAEFLRSHGQTLWATDFFTKQVLTAKGWVHYYVLFFIQVGTRKVHISGVTTNPDEAWMKEQARNMVTFFETVPEKPHYIIHDCDTKYTESWSEILAKEQIKTIRVGPRAPNMNSLAERWIKSIKTECLDLFLVFGEDHLRYLIEQYVAYYHAHRPHRSLNYLPPGSQEEPEEVKTVAIGDVVRREALGGVLSWYERKVA